MAVELELLLLCAVLVTTGWSAHQLEECSTSCKYVGSITVTEQKQEQVHYVYCLRGNVARLCVLQSGAS